MAAISALANLVHCPATPVSSRHLTFPLCKALLGPDAEAGPQQAAILSSLHKVIQCSDDTLLRRMHIHKQSWIKPPKSLVVFAVLIMHNALSTRQYCCGISHASLSIVTKFVTISLCSRLHRSGLTRVIADAHVFTESLLINICAMQAQLQVAEGLANTRCGVAGLSSSLVHSPDMLRKGLQLLLLLFRLSTAACQAASSTFPQVSLTGRTSSAFRCCLVHAVSL